MDQEVQTTPFMGKFGEYSVDTVLVGNVARQDKVDADRLRQGLDALQQRVPLIGERKLRPVRRAGLGDSPGDRAVVGDSHDQTASAGQ